MEVFILHSWEQNGKNETRTQKKSHLEKTKLRRQESNFDVKKTEDLQKYSKLILCFNTDVAKGHVSGKISHITEIPHWHTY